MMEKYLNFYMLASVGYRVSYLHITMAVYSRHPVIFYDDMSPSFLLKWELDFV